jgi:hypothetical protein
MALIETEEAAGRLARVIASDIEIYNRQKIQTGADLSAELAEGYRLFRSRVAPSLLPVFETVLTDKGLLAGKTPTPARLAPPVAARVATPVSVPVAPPVVEPVAPPVAEPVVPPVAASPAPAYRYESPTEPSAPAVAMAISAAVDDLPAVAPPAHAPRFEAFAPPASDGPLPPAEEPSATEERPTFEAARRLARVIISDIKIYNPKKVENGEDLTREIEEGRTLFKARIGADLLPLFEATLEETGLVKKPAPVPARRPTPAATPARRPTPAATLARRPTPVPAPERRFTPVPAAPAVTAPPEPLRARTPFPFDEPTQALEDQMDDPMIEVEMPRPRVATPIPAAAAASALSRVETPFPGIEVAPLRTPTPFLEGPIMRATVTPGPVRRGLPPPIPASARPLRPVPLQVSSTPSPVAVTPAPLMPSPEAMAPAPAPVQTMPAGRFPMPGAPDAAPIAVTTSHRRKPPMRLAAAAAAIVAALALAYLLFSL